jgi:hypothetical protein
VGAFVFAAWKVTGNDAWVNEYFRVPGALLLVILAGVEFFLSLRVCREFSPGEPMRAVWRLIACSAACDVAGAVCVQILGTDSHLNPLPAAPAAMLSSRHVGLVVGGPFRFTLLAAGLYFALRIYRRAGFLARLRRLDWLVLAPIAAYIGVEFGGLIAALGKGKHPGLAEALNWPVAPLLWVLLVEAILLARSVQGMGGGWIGRCWKAFSLGVLLISLGNIGLWATNYGFLPWPWAALTWYVWAPAAAVFAAAPAYQLDVIRFAFEGRASAER